MRKTSLSYGNKVNWNLVLLVTMGLSCLSLFLINSIATEPTTLNKEIARNIEKLREENGADEEAAEKALVEIGAPAVLALAKATSDENATVREHAASALEQMGRGPKAERAAHVLVQSLEQGKQAFLDKGSFDAHSIVQALDSLGPAAKEAIPILSELANIPVAINYSQVKFDAINALGDIGAPAKTAAPKLFPLLHEEGDFPNAAGEALAKIAEDLKEKDDVTAIAMLETVLTAFEDNNIEPRLTGRVRRSLEFLKAEAAAGRGPMPTPDEKARCWNLVVQIEGELDGRSVVGSGVIFGYDKDRLYIATAKHTVRGELSQIAGLKVKTKSLLPGEALAADLTSHSTPELDLAVLVVRDIKQYRIPLEKIPFDRVGKPQSLVANEKVYSLGLPIAEADEPLQSDEFVEADASRLVFRSKTVREGYSGGALFNDNWQLVGMIRADDPRYAHAIAIDQILAQLKEWGYPVNLTAHTP